MTPDEKAAAVACCQANIMALLEHYGLPAPNVIASQTDRIVTDIPEGFLSKLDRLTVNPKPGILNPDAAFYTWGIGIKAHRLDEKTVTAERGWREVCPLWSLQIILHSSQVLEMDVDVVNAHPLEGIAVTVGHAFEVLWNKLRRGKTNPYKVRVGLVKRGIIQEGKWT